MLKITKRESQLEGYIARQQAILIEKEDAALPYMGGSTELAEQTRRATLQTALENINFAQQLLVAEAVENSI